MHRLSALPIVALLVVASCSRQSRDEPLTRKAPDASAAELQLAATADNALGFDLFEALRATEGNLLLCPPSLAEALGIALAGANGETSRELAAVMHVDKLDPARVHAALGALGANLTRNGEGARVDMAAALWAQTGYPINEPFLAATRDNYSADCTQLDFEKAPAEAHERLDQWVEKRTHGKIKRLNLSDEPLPRLLITDAVYFLGKWLKPFDSRDTRDEPFHSPGSESAVPMMHQTNHFRYAEIEAAQILELPYEGRDIAMLVVLPRAADKLADVERTLPGLLEGCANRLASEEVIVSFPRFHISRAFELSGTLTALGAPRAFDAEQADFSNASSRRLHVTAVNHQAVIDVNETHTEAAAVTSMPASEKVERMEHRVFHADHPFLFVIRDARQGTILFIGRFAVPQPDE